MLLVFSDGKSGTAAPRGVSWRRLEGFLNFVGRWANAGSAVSVSVDDRSHTERISFVEAVSRIQTVTPGSVESKKLAKARYDV